MLKKTIKYADYNGTEREETFYFHISKAELTEMEVSKDGGFVNLVNKIVEEQNHKALIALFKEIIMLSYGEKSPDGRRFIKSEELSTAFSQTEAYSILFMELATDAEKATAFINGVVPENM